MTLAELSQYTREHGNRLVALEEGASHTKERVAETAQSIKDVSAKLDKLGWGLAAVLGTAVVHLSARSD